MNSTIKSINQDSIKTGPVLNSAPLVNLRMPKKTNKKNKTERNRMQQSTWNYIFLPFLAEKQSELAKKIHESLW